MPTVVVKSDLTVWVRMVQHQSCKYQSANFRIALPTQLKCLANIIVKNRNYYTNPTSSTLIIIIIKKLFLYDFSFFDLVNGNLGHF